MKTLKEIIEFSRKSSQTEYENNVLIWQSLEILAQAIDSIKEREEYK